MEKSAQKSSEYDDLMKQIEWVPAPVDDIFEPEWERFKRRMMRNPLVPIGFTLTVAVLVTGFRNFYVGNQKMSQKLMRWRVGLQGATVLSLVGGVLLENWMKQK